MLLAPLTYTLAAEEAERIGVDHVARVSSGEAALNSLGNNYIMTSKTKLLILITHMLRNNILYQYFSL